ncbi:hypothetical protein HDU83_007335 [Entophlyctis luteolus]|nr:hypothetical protein HDU82_001307 [Entophlyctis luteolus]KAJ3357404.1 hypothetical protein HDU83_007335 [Entophlyctis luteolus]
MPPSLSPPPPTVAHCVLPAARPAATLCKKRRHPSPNAESAEEDDDSAHDLTVAPPGIDPDLYADALATSKGKRDPAQRDIIKQARIVRNRIAAQASRDRKRKCFNALEVENAALKARLASMEAENQILRAQLNKQASSDGDLSSTLSTANLIDLGVENLLPSPTVSSSGDSFPNVDSASSPDTPLFPPSAILSLGEPAALVDFGRYR